MTVVEERQQEVIADFALLDSWDDRYGYIIDCGRDLPAIDEQYKTEDYLIKGCQSRVWLHAGLEDGKIKLRADSDAIITKGLVALVIRVLNDLSPGEVLSAELHFIADTGLGDHLSPTRANGLVSMIKQIRLYALVFNGNAGAGGSEDEGLKTEKG